VPQWFRRSRRPSTVHALHCRSSRRRASPSLSLPDPSSLRRPSRSEVEGYRRFDPGRSLDRRVNCRCVSQSRWVGARWNTRGNKRGNRGSCYPAPRADALAVGGYKLSRGRERVRACPSARSPARPPSRTRALDLPFIDVRRRPKRTMGSVAMC
jgi:hypothetical protein